MPGTATDAGPMWKTWSAPPKGTVKRSRSRGVEAAPAGAEPGNGDEEVEQRHLAPGRAHHQEAAGARAGQGALRDGRGERGGAHGVHGSAALARASAPARALSRWPAATTPDRRVTPTGGYAASSGPSRSWSSRGRSGG